MAITTDVTPQGVRVPAGQDQVLVPVTDLHPTAPTSITHSQWLRLRAAIRACEDIADAASHIDTVSTDELVRVYARAESEREWVETTLGHHAAQLLHEAEDARWHAPKQATGAFRTCRHCRREQLALDPEIPLSRERNFVPDPDLPELLDWAQLVTIEDVLRVGELPRGWWR